MTATVAGHTIGIERLRDVDPAYKHIHPMITAVVERHGRLVKICKTSVPVKGLEGLSLSAVAPRLHGSVRCAMNATATTLARTYGAQFIGWAR